MATKVRIPSRVTEVLEINYGLEELLKNLKAGKFRIHPIIIDRAIDSLEE